MPNKALYGIPPLIIAVDFYLRHWALHLYPGVKAIVPGVFEVNVLRNPGFTIDWVRGIPLVWVLVIRTVILLVLLGGLGFANKYKWYWAGQYGIFLMVCGGLANGAELVIRGFVTDYLAFGILPVVNMADLLILTGLLQTLFSLVRTRYASYTI